MIIPDIFKEFPELCTGISTKQDIAPWGDMDLSAVDPISYHQDFFRRLGISAAQLAKPVQKHTSKITEVNFPGKYNDCDALVTNKENIALVVSVADCVPVMLFDSVNKVIGVIHAGWRGTSEKITAKTIRAIKNKYGVEPENLRAYIGPSAGVCCYEVDKKIAGKFSNQAVFYKNNKIYLDLKMENMIQLSSEGVIKANIQISKQCTICDSDIFFSYRREGKKAGRMLAVICLKKLKD